MPIHIPSRFPQYIVSPSDNTPNGSLSIRSLGVTTLLMDDGQTQLLFDAHLTRPSLFRVICCKLDSRWELVRQVIDDFDIHRLQGIFLSHTHYDHILDMPAFARITGAPVFGSKSSANVARGNGVPEARIHQFSEGQVFSIGDFKVQVIRSRHSPAHFYNNDLGKTLDHPLSFPARKGEMPEGGSYDFLVTHRNVRVLIRPSCNFIPGELSGIQADVLFFGVGQMDKMTTAQKEACYRETVELVRPRVVIPVHWDDFFLPYTKADYGFALLDRPFHALKYLSSRLEKDNIYFRILPAGDDIII